MPTGIYKRTKEHGNKISEGLMGHKLSEETKRKIGIANQGNKSNLGRKFPKEWRNKISTALKGKERPLMKAGTEWQKRLAEGKIGKHLSQEHKKKLSGANSHRWKGGITAKNKLERVKFRQQIQKAVFARDNYACQICGQRGGYLQVDHIQSWAEYVKGRFNIDNCRTLCMKCHYKITFGKPMPKDTKTWGHNLKQINYVK